MSRTFTICPECGHHSQDSEWCDNCGASLEHVGEAQSSSEEEESEGVDVSEREWLEPGDTFTLSGPASVLLGIEDAPAHAHVSCTLSIDLIAEASNVRHITRASLESFEVTGMELTEAQCADLDGKRFIAEELGSLLSHDEPELPEAVAALVRVPLVSVPRGEHQVKLYLDDGRLSLEEAALRARRSLGFAHVRIVFLAMLDTIEKLHKAGYVYLRISPWTVRLHPAIVAKLPDFEDIGASIGMRDLS
ncbi:MAG: hypothetical protein AAGI01_13250, partial [Myxococcota bacterium]